MNPGQISGALSIIGIACSIIGVILIVRNKNKQAIIAFVFGLTLALIGLVILVINLLKTVN
jgi:drug/metabolite transporter (DMT)-like permease